MKKLCIFLAVAFLAVNVNAQQGSVMLGGGLTVSINNTSTESDDGETFTDFGIFPSFLYFLTDRFALGGQIGFGIQTTSLDASDATLTSIGVGGRYYFLQTQRFGIFAHAALDFGFANNDYYIGNNTTLNSMIAFGIIPGIQYFINDRWSVEVCLAPVLSFVRLTGDVTTHWSGWWPGSTTENVKVNDFNLNLNPFQATINPLRIAVNFHF